MSLFSYSPLLPWFLHALVCLLLELRSIVVVVRLICSSTDSSAHAVAESLDFESDIPDIYTDEFLDYSSGSSCFDTFPSLA